VRIWIAVGCLAGSWLLGLGYLEPPRYVAWLLALLAGVLLLADIPVRFPVRRYRVLALLLLLPVVWFTPLPYQGIAVLLGVGTVLSLVPGTSREPRRLARGAVWAAAILVPQALVLAGYQQMTARAHELPAGMAQALVTLLRAAGVDAALDHAMLVLRGASTTVHVAATWELLWDPATLAFLVGGWALLIAVAAARGASPWRPAALLLLITLAWAPLRAMLLVGLVAHLQLRSDPVMLRNVGELLVSSWAHLGLLGALAVFTGAVMPTLTRTPATTTAPRNRSVSRSPGERGLGVAALCGLTAAVALATFLHFWTPVGQRKGGRVKVVERHSNWEPTTVPYGTELYGEAGSYNYAAAYEYSGQFYDMSRLLDEDPIDDATLATCDVLIIKTPTARYEPEEVAAVVRFVEQGGSLLLIGDHTNVFNMTTFLNDIARPLGFTYRNDLLFQIGDPYKQAYQPPWTSHPVVQHVPPMFFAVSCSIDPGRSSGTMVIRNTGLWNLQPAYHESNYHPQAEYRPEMQYGAWCQLWGTAHGQGRVLGFTDSTLFSNFCVYQPGKAELFIGMLEWLNRSSPWDQPGRQRVLSVTKYLSGLLALVLGVLYVRQRRGNWLFVAALAGIAWTFGALMAIGAHRQAMPLPPRHQVMSHVVIDRTLSSVPLFTGAFADDAEGGGYGMLEQWIPRIGNYISRQSGRDVFQGDGLVVIVPTELPGQAYREELVNWVWAGGQLMVFDTPDVPESTANSLLMLFGLESIRNAPELEDEPLRIADGSAETPIRMSCEIRGGEPVALWGETPVASRIEFGAGTVTAVGFGSLFNDAAMGHHWLVEPDELMLGRYEVLYALLRAALPHQPRD
jgi:hypothetical protein